MAAGTRATVLIDQPNSRLGEVCEGGLNVVDTICDVVQPGAALVEKTLDRRLCASRLQQLDTRACAYESDVDVLRCNALDGGTLAARDEFEKW